MIQRKISFQKYLKILIKIYQQYKYLSKNKIKDSQKFIKD